MNLPPQSTKLGGTKIPSWLGRKNLADRNGCTAPNIRIDRYTVTP